MNKILTVLIVDDHPLIFDGYQRALKQISETNDLEFKVRYATDCDSANKEIERAVNGTPLDLAFLDISLPPSKNHKLISGEDLGLKIKGLFKNVKIIVLTSYTENYRLSHILKHLNPEGFLLKKDITYQYLVDAIETVIFNPPFFSNTVLKLMRKQFSSDIVLDRIDRLLLYQISIGSKMKDIPEVIPLTIGGLEQRKRKLKDKFDLEHKCDRELIMLAKKKGFL
ncbi:MAG: response regulator [Flavobacteriaceae bacterium]|nr:response regulator [Flavobacteriaceae bacterium]